MDPIGTPPLGTKCVDCMCCQAAIYAGKDPVCWECDEGIQCKGRQAAPAKDTMARIEKWANSVDFKGASAGLKVAALLKPRNYPATRKARATKPMNIQVPADNPSPDNRDVNHFKPSQAPQLATHYLAVIKHLQSERAELDRVITALLNFQAKA